MSQIGRKSELGGLSQEKGMGRIKMWGVKWVKSREWVGLRAGGGLGQEEGLGWIKMGRVSRVGSGLD